MGIPVQHDEFGQPISPRFTDAAKPDSPQIDKPGEREGTGQTTLRIRAWLDRWRKCFEPFAEEMGCEVDVMLLVMVGSISQNVQIVADAMEKNARWVRPRVKRLLDMGMWAGGDTLGPRFETWDAVLTGEVTDDNETELGVGMLLDTMEIDGVLESTYDDDGELLWRLREHGTKSDGEQ